MLVRAARRKAPTSLRQRISGDSLYLPFLCPAVRGDLRRPFANDAATRAPGLRKRSNSRDRSIIPRRSLATAVDFRPEDDIPFEKVSNNMPIGYGDLPIHQLRPFSPSSALVLGGSIATAPVRHRRLQGVGGNLSEIVSILEACLHVGRIERASVILKRITRMEMASPELLLHLHNQYLRTSIDKLTMNPTDDACLAIHKWFELEIRSNNITPNEETLAYMMKASMYTPKGKRQERLVKRYIELADEGYQVLLHDILTPEEMNTICQICPEIQFQDTAIDLNESEYDAFEGLEGLPQQAQSVPEVMEVQQKGLGLKALKQTLSLFHQNPYGLETSALSYEERRLLQQKIETDAVDSSINRWRDESENLKKMGFDTALQTKSLGARMWRWQGVLEQLVKDDLEKIELAESMKQQLQADIDRCSYGPFLRYLPPERVAAITIVATMTALTKNGVDKGLSLAQLINNISDSLEDECLYHKVKVSGGNKERLQTLRKDRMTRFALRKMVAELTPDTPESKKTAIREQLEIHWQDEWPKSIKAKLGAFLVSALMESAKLPVTREHPETKQLLTQQQPAFTHSQHYKLGKKIGVVLANEALVQQLKREPVHSLLAKHLPMLVPPEPWTGFSKGAFLVHPAKMMRIKLGDKEQRYYAEAAILKGDMAQTFKGLDVLGKTAWRINQPVFDVMLEAWNKGESVANIAPADPQIEIPAEPEEASENPSTRRAWINAVKIAENTRSGLHSQRCFQNFQLEIARALRNETFYFPHNIDFRGRAYPIPPYLNHMGADHCRGILMFGRGKELGEEGLKWLKIQLANVFGYDKASLKEREDFAAQHMADIVDSVEKPLAGNRWWLQAEDPWQCLAACFEIKNALESPDPKKFVSHLPIHQDGTCNGLQHYAALGGDEAGAKQVNLEPGDRPGDVYTAVAELVKEHIQKDLQQDNKYAKLLDGKITRKVVKQTVMTNVYGVTFMGAKAQVKKQLTTLYPELPNTNAMNPNALALYVATKIFKSLSTMFRGAHDIQYWFAECANRITMSYTAEQVNRIETDWSWLEEQMQRSSAVDFNKMLAEEYGQFRSSVIWTNPLKMPVVQPYRDSKQRQISTNLQSVTLSDPHVSDPVSRRKQLQGFPPNFIHSLDATHMTLSALQCDEMGLAFAAVHDSFWTHASDVQAMNGVLRDAFIRIHSEDVIGRLAAEFEARYKGSMYLARVKGGSRLHQKLMDHRAQLKSSKEKSAWDTAHSTANRFKNLILERKRLTLLASSDPEKVAEGKAMVTPGSIYEEFATEGDLESGDGVEAVALGGMAEDKPEQKSATSTVVENEDASHMEDEMAIEMEENLQEKALNVNEISVSAGDEIASETSKTVPAWESEAELSGWAQSIRRIRKRNLDSPIKEIQVWLPMKFPPVPEKGKFDVSRLINSDYFFS